jgi:predicted peptidase
MIMNGFTTLQVMRCTFAALLIGAQASAYAAPQQTVFIPSDKDSGRVYASKLTFILDSDTLPYRFIEPLGTRKKKYPLIVYLHGSGARGNDNEKPLQRLPAVFTDSVARTKYPCYILVPQCPEKDVWVNFPDFPQSLSATAEPTPSGRMVLQLIRHLIADERIDADRIYLTGYSMGGEGTYDLLSREPELFACGVPLAAVADTSKAGAIKHIPLWAFHGEEDKVNGIQYDQWMIDALRQHGGHPRFTPLPGIGHNCQNEAYTTPGLWQWMFEQHRKR